MEKGCRVGEELFIGSFSFFNTIFWFEVVTVFYPKNPLGCMWIVLGSKI